MTAPFRAESEGRTGNQDDKANVTPADCSIKSPLDDALESLRLTLEERYSPDQPREFWWMK